MRNGNNALNTCLIVSIMTSLNVNFDNIVGFIPTLIQMTSSPSKRSANAMLTIQPLKKEKCILDILSDP